MLKGKGTLRSVANKMKKLFTIFIIPIISIVILGMSPRQEGIERNIKVLIKKNISTVKVNGSVLNLYDQRGAFLKKMNGPIFISCQTKGMMLNRISLDATVIQFESENKIVKIGENGYRGRMIFSKNMNQKGMDVINEIPLEEYLKGVVPAEMDPEAPLEALKAQAVAARTYAYYYMLQNAHSTYDMELPQNTQAYKGILCETEKTSQAVEETRGIILKYEDQVYPTFYHTQCGGFTTSSSKVWSVTEDGTTEIHCRPCGQQKGNQWSYRIRMKDFRKRLEESGYFFQENSKIIIYRNSFTNRVEIVKIGNNQISANELRKILGPNRLKSTFFEASLNSRTINFFGRGWGHGVGLCQFGAIELAKEGKSFKRILKYYYPKNRMFKAG